MIITCEGAGQGSLCCLEVCAVEVDMAKHRASFHAMESVDSFAV